MSREEAVIAMVDSNLQREHILPSEKAFAYKMKMDALRKKAGRPPFHKYQTRIFSFRYSDTVTLTVQ